MDLVHEAVAHSDVHVMSQHVPLSLARAGSFTGSSNTDFPEHSLGLSSPFFTSLLGRAIPRAPDLENTSGSPTKSWEKIRNPEPRPGDSPPAGAGVGPGVLKSAFDFVLQDHTAQAWEPLEARDCVQVPILLPAPSPTPGSLKVISNTRRSGPGPSLSVLLTSCFSSLCRHPCYSGSGRSTGRRFCFAGGRPSQVH